MRRLAGIASLAAFAGLAAAPAPAHASKASNPAFLGVGMDDMGGAPGVGPCVITSVEPDSSAAAASLERGDVFEALDGDGVANCDALVKAITARAPGTEIRLDMRRHAQPLTVKTELITRDEILRRRLVGQPLPPTDLLRVDDRTAFDLAAVKRPTIVGWYPTNCSGCDGVFASVARWNRERGGKRAPISVIAATAGDLGPRRSTIAGIEQLKLAQRSLDVPLHAAEPDVYARYTIRDIDRVYFMVLDGRGTVQYVAPILPNTDDTSAMLDELYAAAEQAARRTR